jgi:hypothetical protein
MTGYNETEQDFANWRNKLRREQRTQQQENDTMNIGNHRSRSGWNNEPRTSPPNETARKPASGKPTTARSVNHSASAPCDEDASASAPPIFEQGPRDVIRCCLPHGHERDLLQRQLAEIAGGFTRFPHVGGWINENGELEVEQGFTYEVSFASGDSRILNQLLTAFRTAGKLQGEAWTHIEHRREAFEAHHTDTLRWKA